MSETPAERPVIMITEARHGGMRVRPPRRTEERASGVTKMRVGHAEFACPECGGEVNTDGAAHSEQMPAGLRFVGVPCAGTCGNTYTVELSDAELAE